MSRKSKTLYSVQRWSAALSEWRTLVDFKWIPRGEANGALRMADAHYGGPRYRVVVDDPKTGVGEAVSEGGGRPHPSPA